MLSALDDAERRELIGVARSRTFAKGEVVCHEGDPADSVHLVAEGRLSVRVSLPSGDAAMVNLLGPGDCFGEVALLRKDGRRTATITAHEKARTLVITESAFNRVCETHPKV